MNIPKLDPATSFAFKPGDYVPFKNREICEKVRQLSGKDIEKREPWHNKDFNIKVMMNPHPVLIATLFNKIKESDVEDKVVTLLLGNPEPETYIPLAQLINYHRVNCRNVHLFAEDEWADEDGNIAPLTYEAGFGHSLFKYFFMQIDEDLRMPVENVHYFTNETVDHYSDLMVEIGNGGVDILSSSPGWTGHMAFVDPVPDWMDCARKADGTWDMDAYFEQKAKICTLHPLTVAQNSLHGVFGMSGYVASVPPKAATIGPFDVKHAKERVEVHALQTCCTESSWQRMTSRLVLHAPVTPEVPSSMLQLLPTQVYVSDELAAPFECWEKKGY